MKPRSAPPLKVPSAPAQALPVLVASHSHPEFSKGGAEIAAYHLFAELRRRTGFDAWFLGCVRDPAHQKLGTPVSQPFSDREYLYAAGEFDWFHFANRDPKFPPALRELLSTLRPRIVHFHHYLNLGLEALLHVRETLPDAKIVLTLHEYLAVCHHYGQMVTKQHRTLCYAASPIRCSACFEEHAPADFFLRTLYIKRFFDLVDCFVAPSEFLAQRYLAWGLPQERVTVIENPIPVGQDSPGAAAEGRGVLRIGFFGQISVLKGIDVLLDAAEAMAERGIDDIVLEIHGDYSGQPAEFQEGFLKRLPKVPRNVKFHGPYDHARVDHLMRSVHAVLVPSIWWENSPLVIQEALRNRRPVICSDIGGMAEKVRAGLDGFHFPVGNASILAALLIELKAKPSRLAALDKTLRRPEDTTDQYARLYASLG